MEISSGDHIVDADEQDLNGKISGHIRIGEQTFAANKIPGSPGDMSGKVDLEVGPDAQGALGFDILTSTITIKGSEVPIKFQTGSTDLESPTMILEIPSGDFKSLDWTPSSD